MFVSLLVFISLVWLKDQLTTGHGPNWLTADQEEVQRQAEVPREVRKQDDPRTKLINEAHCKLRIRQKEGERIVLAGNNANLRSEMEVSCDTPLVIKGRCP